MCLWQDSIKVFKKPVVKLYENGRSIIVKKYNHTGKSITDNTKDYSNLLNQDFKIEKPSKNWLEI